MKFFKKPTKPISVSSSGDSDKDFKIVSDALTQVWNLIKQLDDRLSDIEKDRNTHISLGQIEVQLKDIQNKLS